MDQRGVATYEVNVGFCWTSERSNGHVDLFGSFWAQEPVANFKCAQGSTKMLGHRFPLEEAILSSTVVISF